MQGSSPIHITNLSTKLDAASIARIKESIMKTLLYFDIFQYPLTSPEVKNFLDNPVSEIDLHEALGQLLHEKKIFLREGFFSVQNNPLLVSRRKEGNVHAGLLLKRAEKIGRFLYRFPYVRAIGISGSLSKNYADQHSDIDFFVITRTNRLWIARTFMHLYKKLTFLTSTQHFHCMNYYIDESALLVPEQNIFTAIEIKTLVPVSGESTMKLFFDTNEWTKNWFPALPLKKQENKNPQFTWTKKFTEWTFNSRLGNAIDNFLFRLTRKRWERKEKRGKKNLKGQPMGLISDKHFAWSNPGNFREKVLNTYKQKLLDQNIPFPETKISFLK